MGRLADCGFLSFSLRPEWDPTKPINPEDIKIDVIMSRYIKQAFGIDSDCVKDIQAYIRSRIAHQHIQDYGNQLRMTTGMFISVNLSYIHCTMSRNLLVSPSKSCHLSSQMSYPSPSTVKNKHDPVVSIPATSTPRKTLGTIPEISCTSNLQHLDMQPTTPTDSNSSISFSMEDIDALFNSMDLSASSNVVEHASTECEWII